MQEDAKGQVTQRRISIQDEAAQQSWDAVASVHRTCPPQQQRAEQPSAQRPGDDENQRSARIKAAFLVVELINTLRDWRDGGFCSRTRLERHARLDVCRQRGSLTPPMMAARAPSYPSLTFFAHRSRPLPPRDRFSAARHFRTPPSVRRPCRGVDARAQTNGRGPSRADDDLTNSRRRAPGGNPVPLQPASTSEDRLSGRIGGRFHDITMKHRSASIQPEM